MKHTIKIFSVSAFTLLLFSVVLLGFENVKKNDPDSDNVTIHTDQSQKKKEIQAYTIKVSVASQKLSGIKAKLFTPSKQTGSILTYGKVLSTDSLLSGFRNYHMSVIKLEQAKISLAQSTRIYQRLKRLYQTQNTAKQDYQTAQSNWKLDKADLQSAKIQFQSLRSNLLQDWGPVIAKWIEGNSTEWKLLSYQKAYIISATLPDSISTIPHEIKINRTDGYLTNARFISKAPVLDSRFQENNYFYLCRNVTSLTPGMNIKVWFKGKNSNVGFWIPDSCIVWWNGFPWYFQKTGSDTFRQVRVTSGLKQHHSWFVTDQTMKPDTIVVQGSQLILSQELRSEIASKIGDDD